MDTTQFSFLGSGADALSNVLEVALSGDVDAQFAVGLIYCEGRGVEVDMVQAFFWLTRAIDRGSEEAAMLRQLINAEMSDEEYDQAIRLIQLIDRIGFHDSMTVIDGETSH